MDLICGLVDKFCNLVINLTWEQLRYLIYYHRNIDELNGQLMELTLKRSSIQHRIEEAKNNVEQILEEVHHWLAEVDAISEQVHELRRESEAKLECGITSCPNPYLRYKLSKRAETIAQEAVKICAKGYFERVGYRVPPQSMSELTNRESNREIDSRVKIKNHIMEALRNTRFNMIGLCGLGGVGKTTIAKDIEKEEENQKVFKKVIMATVSQEMNIGQIQDQIIEKLGMQLNERTEDVKAYYLYKRLENEKNMLLILDDLWKELDLGKVGIPFVDVERCSKINEGCKILLTSRNETLLSKSMKCQKIIRVDVLLEDEAWELFESIAELAVESSSPDLKFIATEIVQKCEGLPLAIATAAKALKDKNTDGWRDYLLRLKDLHHLARSFTGIKEIDNVLKLSYDALSQENKDIFLLSAMLSHDPSIEDLLMYSVGLDIFKHTQNMGDARNAIFDIVAKLKSLNLFLDSFSSHHFTMHDVFRDLALSISSKELNAVIVRHSRLNEWPDENDLECCKGICLQESDICDLPEELHGPILEFFLLDSKKSDLTISNMFFKSSKKLKVLAITKVNFSSLPSLCFLERLKALCLHSCLLEDITEIRSLRKLKVLSLAYSEIQRLPIEVAKLTSLQMLNLSHCSKLKVIPQKLLSSLKKLEVLYMGNSFDQWKVEESSKADENASLDELMDLPISSLEIHIPNLSMLPENLFLKMNLRRYRIFIGERWRWQSNYGSSKILKLELESSIDLTAGLRNLSKGAEDLHLYGSNGHANVLYNLDDASGFPCLRHLHIGSNDDIKYIVLNSAHHEDAFPILESLELNNLEALENLCEGPNDIVFRQLHTLKLENLPTLTGDFNIKDRAIKNASSKIFKSLFNMVLLPKLETLKLSHLSNNLISFIWDDQLLHNSFKNLKTLMLRGCGFMKTVPLRVLKNLNNLEKLKVNYCYKLEMVFDFQDLNDYHKEMGSSSVVGPLSLTHLEVNRCNALTTLMSSAASRLVHITHLSISLCYQIEEIITKQEGEDDEVMEIIFNQMKSLELDNLPRLKRFCGYNYAFRFPLLEHVTITECPRLTMFCLGAINAPRLRSIGVHTDEAHKKDIWMTDFSNTMEHLFTFEEVISTIRSMAINAKNITRIVDVFPEVMSLYVESFTDEGVTFPYSSLEKFPKLDSLNVEHCSFEEIFPSQDQIIGFMGKISPFEVLCIAYMDKLKSIWKDDSQLPPIHQNLTCLRVKSCCSLVQLAPPSASFQNLKELYVTRCHQLIHLLTTSTAKTLVSLRWLLINDCKRMEKIVMNDTNEDVQGGITFNELYSIKLTDMPSLKMFSAQNHNFEFPQLEEIEISGCPKMKKFCPGVFSTPKLSKVKIEEHDKEWKDEEDVNKTMKGISLAKDSINI